MFTEDIKNVVAEVADSVAVATPQVVEGVESTSEVANKFANVGWGEMLLMAGIGFLIVFLVLVLLIFIMRGMGWFFTRERKPRVAATPVSEPASDHAISDQELVAAIATALKLYKSDLHDRESETLTINRITRAYSPWNSKIHGLTQLPEKH